MRYLLLSLVLAGVCFATEVKIVSQKFTASEVSSRAKFSGNVVVTKQKDVLKSDELIVFFNKKRKPTKYEAVGKASANVFLRGKEYFAKGKKLIYEPKSGTYTIKGNAVFIDKTTNKKVYGEIIRVNQKDGKYEVDGKNNEPVKFIFEIDDKEASKKLGK